MSTGNTILLVCTPCMQDNLADFGIKLGTRPRKGSYKRLVPNDQFNAWLTKHSACGGPSNPDHFQLAHAWPQNHDQRTLQDAVETQLGHTAVGHVVN